jgi:hypothetical protein
LLPERFKKICGHQDGLGETIVRQRLGQRQPSAALRRTPSGGKAVEGRRSPKPRGIIQPAFRRSRPCFQNAIGFQDRDFIGTGLKPGANESKIILKTRRRLSGKGVTPPKKKIETF